MKNYIKMLFASSLALIGAFGFSSCKVSRDQEAIESTTENAAVIREIESCGLRLASTPLKANDISPQVENGYLLTATVQPTDASNQTVDWTMTFVNPASTWASGKTVTDYLTLTPSTDGALTAQVALKNGFGEQIKITVTSRENRALFAQCTVDYVKRVSHQMNISSQGVPFGSYEGFVCNKSYGTGTLQGTYKHVKTTVTLSEGVKEAFPIRPDTDILVGKSYKWRYSFKALETTNSTVRLSSDPATDFATIELFTASGGAVTQYDMRQTLFEQARKEFKSALKTALESVTSANHYGTHATLAVEYENNYNGKNYASGPWTNNLIFASNTLSVSAQSVSVDTEELIL